MLNIINKIYIDSRFKTFDSASNSNFKIELKENYLVPDNYGAVITYVRIPRSRYTKDSKITSHTSHFKVWLRIPAIAVK